MAPHGAAWGSTALIATAICFAALYGHAQPMSIDVVAMNDPNNIGMVTEMTVRVHNGRSIVQRPIFTVISSFPFPVRWSALYGPKALPPGATATYTIEAPTNGAILTGDYIVARVNDARSHVFGVSPIILASLHDTLALVNSAFDKWTLDFATGEPAPLGWTAEGISSPLDTNLRIAHAVVAGRSAAIFMLGGGGRGWEGIRMDQYVKDPKRVSRLFTAGFTALVYPSFTSTPGFGPLSAGAPGNVFAVQVYADGHLLWFVFSDRPPSWNVERNTAVVALYAPLDRWSTHKIDIAAVYRRLGWSEPRELMFTIMAGLAGGTSGKRWPAFGAISQ